MKHIKITALCIICICGILSSFRMQREIHQTTSNPHALITDENKVNCITSLQEIDSARLYVMDYTVDYHLDEMIAEGVNSMEKISDFLAKYLFDVSPKSVSFMSPSAGCSAYAATNADNGDFLYGRNYDYCHVEKGTEIPTAAIMVRTAPKGGKKSISMIDAYWVGFHRGFYNDGKTDISMLISAPYQVLDGVNEDGFAASVLHLGGKPTCQDNPDKNYVWANILMRIFLDSVSTVEEAVKMAEKFNMSMKSPAGGNLHFFLADATGDYAILEYSYADAAISDETLPNVMKVFRGRDCDRYVTNFYVDPVLAEHPKLGPRSNRGLWRYDTLKVNLANKGYKLTDSEAMGLLKAVSQDSKPNVNTSHTQWSAMYNLSKRKVDISILQEFDTKYTFWVE